MRLPDRPHQDGGIVIILGMPPGFEFGIDMQINQVGPHFRGVAGVPMGIHLLTFGTGKGLRQGFFINITRPYEVIVKSWNALDEELIEEGTGLPEGSMRSLLDALQRGELNKHLGAYPDRAQGGLWRQLTKYVTADVLSMCGLALETRILPGDWEEENVRSRGAGEEAGEVVSLCPGGGRAAVFTDMGVRGRLRDKKDMTPATLTRYHMDRSELLEDTLRDVYSKMPGSSSTAATAAKKPSPSSLPSPPPSSSPSAWMNLLGEQQLGFLLFLNLFSMAGLRHWKETTALLCQVSSALPRHLHLFRAFLKLLRVQLQTAPSDFFVDEDEVGKGSFLAPSLQSLMRNVREAREEGGGDDILRCARTFAAAMEKDFPGLELERQLDMTGVDVGEGLTEGEEGEEGPQVLPWEEYERIMRGPTAEEEDCGASGQADEGRLREQERSVRPLETLGEEEAGIGVSGDEAGTGGREGT